MSQTLQCAFKITKIVKRFKFGRGLGQLTGKKLLSETVMNKIFAGNTRFHVKYRTAGKVQYDSFFIIFFTSNGEILFLEEDWALG